MCQVDAGRGGPAQAPRPQPAGVGRQWGPGEDYKILSIKSAEAVIL